jgi:hypothetical protein
VQERRNLEKKEMKLAQLLLEETNPEDKVTLDIPLFIRLLEYAREDAQADVDLHFLADNAIRLSAEGEVLNMDHYNDLIKQDETKPAN